MANLVETLSERDQYAYFVENSVFNHEKKELTYLLSEVPVSLPITESKSSFKFEAVRDFNFKILFYGSFYGADFWKLKQYEESVIIVDNSEFDPVQKYSIVVQYFKKFKNKDYDYFMELFNQLKIPVPGLNESDL